ncbi:MAG TPA: hypothetical protein VK879_08840 [Candidatus Sulfomarinibacteraceae bacterium]|nr:hypothetical protein [Candidatus Sulfomarinibacteraceae bacterium]
MRLFHLAGCLVRAVKVVPAAAITAIILPLFLIQSGEQLALLLETDTGRLFLYAFAGIFLLSIVGGLGRRRRELGCVVTLLAVAPFLLLGAVTAFITSALTVTSLGAGPVTESGSFLGRFWAVLATFPPAVQVPTIAGAFLGFIGLAGDITYGTRDD